MTRFCQEFENDLKDLLDHYEVGKPSRTPHFLLARRITAFLDQWDQQAIERERFEKDMEEHQKFCRELHKGAAIDQKQGVEQPEPTGEPLDYQKFWREREKVEASIQEMVEIAGKKKEPIDGPDQAGCDDDDEHSEQTCGRCCGNGQCELLSGIEWDYHGPDHGTCPACGGRGTR